MDHILSSKRKDAPVKHSPVLLLKLPKASVDVEGPTKVALPLLVAVLSRTRLFPWDREPRQNILYKNVGARDFDLENIYVLVNLGRKGGRVGGKGLNELYMPLQHTSIAEGRYVFQFLRCFEQNLIIQTMDQKALCSTGQV